jgi:hypothetical protein
VAKKPINEIIEAALGATTNKTTKKAVKPAAKKAAAKTVKSRGSVSAAKKKPAIALSRAEKRELNSASHWAARERDLADRAAAKAAEKATKREQNRAMWREMQSDRSIKRQAAWDKYKKKKGM